MSTENFYRLTKKELSFIRSIEEPIISSRGERLSRPVIVALLGDKVLYVWTLRWFRYKVKRDSLPSGLVYELHAMY